MRERFEVEAVEAIAEVLSELGPLAPSDRQPFHQIAALAFDRRLAHHTMQWQAGGRG
ncbi:hypothetical protein [Aureimonas endophytica]|uniref:hypothetical protein n=1 Tax=Aureimonas endophytica TaxID=2027858 RepID=UPI0016682501|nr:hypothetical protein [Aureimonas endophytica]